MNLQLIASYVCIILAFVPAIVFHEVAHGFMAWKLGDPTAKSMGRLSANPLKHIDMFGTVILPLFLMVMNLPVFGYAKPVPYNPLYFKDKRKGDFLVGIAGPLANFVMAFIGALVMNLLWPWVSTLYSSDIGIYFYFVFLPEFILINLYLMFFNLIPIPPLDGSSIIALFIPERSLPKYYAIQRYALPVLLILIIFVPYIINFNPISAYLNFTAGNLASIMMPISIF